jgi:hypothetical protein
MTALPSNNAAPEDRDALIQAGEIIDRFGGIRPMANKMRVPVTTVQGWKKRGVIPGNRRAEIIRAASDYQVDLAGLLGAPGSAPVTAKPATASVPNSFSAEVRAASTADTIRPAPESVRPVTASPANAAPTSQAPVNQDALMSRISASHKSAVRKSVMISTIIMLGTAVIAILLLAPAQQRIEQRLGADDQRMDALEGRVSAVEGRGKIGNLISDALSSKITELKEQATLIKQSLDSVTGTAQAVLGPNAGDLSQRVSALESRIGMMGGAAGLNVSGFNSLLDKIKGLQQSADGQTQMDAALKQLQVMINDGGATDVDQALEQAQAQPESALGQTLQGIAPSDLKAAAMLMALSQFRSSVGRQAPFKDDLQILYKMAGDNDPELQASIERLAPQAEAGVLSTQGISSQLRGLAGDIVVASLEGEDVSVREKAMARLNDVMQVRKDGELVSGTDTQAKIARAQDLLDKGDVQGAIAELEALEGGAKEKAQPVIVNAQMSMLAGQVQKVMSDKVMAQLQSSGAIPAGTDINQILQQIGSFMPSGSMSSDPTGAVRVYTPAPSFPAIPKP